MRITAEEVTRHPFTIASSKSTPTTHQVWLLHEDEREAVEQELMAKVIANWPKFDEQSAITSRLFVP